MFALKSSGPLVSPHSKQVTKLLTMLGLPTEGITYFTLNVEELKAEATVGLWNEFEDISDTYTIHSGNLDTFAIAQELAKLFGIAAAGVERFTISMAADTLMTATVDYVLRLSDSPDIPTVEFTATLKQLED